MSICFLFYLDGNNEIEPEIYNAFENLLRFKSKEVELFIEVGRENREFIKVIRPFENIHYDKNLWTGVRRYHIRDGYIEYFDLGKRNMAHPKELYDFICWGLKVCRAKYNALVIASHGFSFVGGITDLTFDVPYVMPIEDMSYSINKALLDCRKGLDLLFLDMCYMNYIEILYEIKKRYDNINYILTYYGEGDFGGIDYISFIENFYSLIERNKDFLYFMERDNLILSRPTKSKVKDIKCFCNVFAEECILKGYNDIEAVKRDIGLLEVYKKINNIVCFKSENSRGVQIIDFYIDELYRIYKNLAFSINNKWFNLISKDFEGYSTQNINFLPKRLTKSAILGLILSLNGGIDIKEATNILNNVVKVKGWNI
ncbi:MAG: alpha-clostripain-like protein [Caloramator sp.]|jgi:hypothetical protein|uniref:clostripain-related cysteine peptidase n=1 Tax=Caloramator sp. TaxID=1871330 RepID=UPI001D92DDF3|nr:clostripain-related cysteine peptidase [Caloramator sp.]MBZ4662592.1 alpha-clostripain-like protein [Caloramator sp.]